MTLKDFDYIVNQVILERGKKIFEGNKVIYNGSYACSYNFTVQGTELYNVEISCRDDLTITYLSCNCPYTNDRICKHEIACLFYLRDMKNIKALV